MKLDSAGLLSVLPNQLSSVKRVNEEQTRDVQIQEVSAAEQRLVSSGPQFTVPENGGYTTLQGKDRVLMVENSEKTTRMTDVLQRLDEDQRSGLVDSELIQDEKFLKLAESLSDKELGQLANAIEGLQTLPEQNVFSATLHPQHNAERFVERLAGMDGETRSRVLEKADLYASRVPVRGQNMYLPDGTSGLVTGHPAANDLHNFAHAVGVEPDTGTMLDRMAEFSDAQQSKILDVLGKNTELGGTLMETLSHRDNNARDTTLAYLSDLMTSDWMHISLDLRSGSDETVSSRPGYDNNTFSVIDGMVKDVVGLLENYEFSDDQVTQMSSQLLSLDRSDQRAYIAVTEVGLNQLVEPNSEHPSDMSDQTEVMAVIDGLRSDERVRDAVFMSRMGEQTHVSDRGHAYYEQKLPANADRDQNAMIQVLTADAWLNRTNDENDLASRSRHIAENLSSLSADQRDQWVHELNRLSDQPVALAELSDRYLNEDTADFQARTEAMADTKDLAALIETSREVDSDQRDVFWEAAAAAETEVDQFVELLQGVDAEMGEKMLTHLESELAKVIEPETAKEHGRDSIHELIDFFEANLDQDDRERFVATLT